MLSKAEDQEGHYELCKNNDGKAQQKRNRTVKGYHTTDKMLSEELLKKIRIL